MASPQRERYLKKYVPLHIAALQGDWKAAKGIIDQNPTDQLVNAHITEGQETALHVAAAAEHVYFVEKLVDKMDENHLEIQNKMGNTALSFAAATGNVRIAKYMVTKNPILPSIRGPQAKSPLYYAALLGQRDMVEYLLDAALSIVEAHPRLALARDHMNGETPLDVLARKPSAFAGGNQRGLWETIIDAWTLKELIATYRDPDDNNMLHLAAKLALPNQINVVSGAALQMQRQLVLV
ncbi:hypothetical protein F0562_025199 [Nyssa sinensis]|uniref:Uncharacterized protein n=1 Tax=Nyssa sinensis TaxID=561372 RepID=A0A5J5BEQ1_9ASTE|nr:hypothetical protein F0562_025199 [Nyssa sinensis]